jgi:hypothetical protein
MTTIWLVKGLGGVDIGAVFDGPTAQRFAEQRGHHMICQIPLLPTHRHYKGGEYAFIGHGAHTETMEQFVAYTNDKGLWLRPHRMFYSSVDEPGYAAGPRFTLL